MMRKNDKRGMSRGNSALLVVGELNVDLIFAQVNKLPELEKERTAQKMNLVLGSSSAILASNAQSMGRPTGFVGCVGADSFGSFVVEALSDRKVDTAHIKVLEGVSTGATVIYTYQNQRGMITYPGAMSQLTVDGIPWDYVRQFSHLHVSSLFLQEGLRSGCKRLFSKAKHQGLTTSLDTGWDPAEEWGPGVLDILAEVDVFLPNDEEARRISGRDELTDALDILSSRAARVVITRGREGVLATDGNELFRLPSIAVEPVDAVGAGDSFNAGFLHYFIDGRPFDACLQNGLLSGAYSTQAAGGTAAFQEGDFQAFAADHRNTRS